MSIRMDVMRQDDEADGHARREATPSFAASRLLSLHEDRSRKSAAPSAAPASRRQVVIT
jgi:hypothetical protein